MPEGGESRRRRGRRRAGTKPQSRRIGEKRSSERFGRLDSSSSDTHPTPPPSATLEATVPDTKRRPQNTAAKVRFGSGTFKIEGQACMS